jgi:hypothetical protein
MNRIPMRAVTTGALVLLGLAAAGRGTYAQPAADAPITSAFGPWEDAGLTPERLEADWLRQEAVRGAVAPKGPGGAVRPEQDASGAVDGQKTGKWGFHTENEENPWWQVDLGRSVPVDRVVITNRGDGLGDRAARMRILLSEDGKEFRQAYQHDGTPFLKDLSVPLKGAAGRFVRLQLPGRSYFHLDEVEVYAAGGTENVALKKPATQSSVSEWSAAHGGGGSAPVAPGTGRVVERGLKLAEDLRGRGLDTAADEQALRAIGERAKAQGADAPAEAGRRLFLDACRAVRRLALRNPLLDFDTILFTKGAPGRFPHLSDQHYGWWARPGGGLYLLQGIRGDAPRLRCLTPAWAPGNFSRPDLSWDGKRVLFSYCRFYANVPELKDKATKANLPEDAFYHVYEMDLGSGACRRISRGRYDDFDARYLPDGDIVFLSTRKGVALQCTKAASEATRAGDLPDSYVRCGGDNYRPVPVFTLHRMDARGENLRPISAFENFEWTPAVSNDGRILYTRWDYIDRFNGHFFSLWVTNPDGTNPQLVYGNYTVRPQGVIDARPVPGSTKLLFTASAHHSITGGSLVLLDRARGTEELAPLVRLTPEVVFPETEGWPEHYYVTPWPLAEEHVLTAWSDRKLPPHCRVDDSPGNPPNATGIYLYDAFGSLTLLHRDPAISCASPIPVRPRPLPPVLADTVAWDGPAEGRFLVQDVYQGLLGVPRGAVKRLRVVAVPPKVQPHMNHPNLGVSAEDPGKYVLGTAPVEPDGSAYFRAPSGIPLFFQAIDADGLSLQTMRSLTYVWPNQTLSCVGCHEGRDAAPPPAARAPLAAGRDPSRLTPGPDGSWPLRFDRLVGPVLDRKCVSCHKPGAEDRKAAALVLTPDKAYETLLTWADKDLHKLVFEKDRSVAGETPSRRSRLMTLLRAEGGHAGVKLDRDDLDRLATWMDVYAHRLGHFSERQEEDLVALRKRLGFLLAE